MPRPKLYATAAERQAAFRERHARLDLTIPREMGDTLDEIAGALAVSKNELAESMLRFALTNRNWKTQGMVWGRKS